MIVITITLILIVTMDTFQGGFPAWIKHGNESVILRSMDPGNCLIYPQIKYFCLIQRLSTLFKLNEKFQIWQFLKMLCKGDNCNKNEVTIV